MVRTYSLLDGVLMVLGLVFMVSGIATYRLNLAQNGMNCWNSQCGIIPFFLETD
jgi:uncharacterized membrane-anchored protein